MASNAVPRHILLTGIPGVGKTTLVKKACQALETNHIPVQGFYTSELRDKGKRIGFDVITLDGQTGALARVQEDNPVPGANRRRVYKVGQYTVQLQSFETTAIPTLKIQHGGQPIFVIDEIGKMELFSESFVKAVQNLLDLPHSTVLCTIPVPRGKPLPFVDQVRKRPDVVLYEVTHENRNRILNDIVQAIFESRKTYRKDGS